MLNGELQRQIESYRVGLQERRRNKEFVKDLIKRVEEHIARNQPFPEDGPGEQTQSLEDVLKEIEGLLSRMDAEIKRGTEFNFNKLSLQFKGQFVKVAEELKAIEKRSEELEEMIGNDTNFITLLYDRLTHYKERTAIYYQLFQEVTINL